MPWHCCRELHRAQTFVLQDDEPTTAVLSYFESGKKRKQRETNETTEKVSVFCSVGKGEWPPCDMDTTSLVGSENNRFILFSR